ncbi:MAG: tail fiber domain-containing protein [Ginsengibacter sp.]
MKKLLLIFTIIFLASFAIAQSPELMSYQAVIRDAAGKIVAEKPVGIRMSILQKTGVGNSVYTETHTASTNKNGLVSVQIGNGTLVSGSIGTINWEDGPYFLQTEIDPLGGVAYSVNNTSQMMSVPYALFAKSAGGSWNSLGNEISTFDYLGTNNDKPLVFRVNKERAGYLDAKSIYLGVYAGYNNHGKEDIAIGYSALYSTTTGYSNIAMGKYALTANTTGFANMALGDSSLFKNTTGSNNLGNGNFALYSNMAGNSNTATGFKSLYTNGVGSYNVANGNYSLYTNYSGSYNVANGYNSLYANNTGYENVANGNNALFSNQYGYRNVANGANALYNNTKGEENVANGYTALFSNLTGAGNVASGREALYSNISGHYNTGIGTLALYSTTTGLHNTGIGRDALSSNTTGSDNTTIGAFSNVTSGNLENATAIGYGTDVNASNKVRIGNTDVTKIEGQVAFSFPSDARFKYNIRHNVPGLDFIRKLQPVTYYFDNDKLNEFTKTGVINSNNIYRVSYKEEKEIQTGFLAQDVEKAANELGYHFDGVRTPSNDKDHYSLAYSQFIMPLVKGMQEQQTMIDQQNKDIRELRNVIKKLETKISEINTK